MGYFQMPTATLRTNIITIYSPTWLSRMGIVARGGGALFISSQG